MKKLLFVLLASFLGYGAIAQPAGSVQVRNYTGCWVYYSMIGGPGSCGNTMYSTPIALAPGGSIFYPNTASIPGFPPGGGNGLNGANVYYGPPSCPGGQLWRVGTPCTGMLPAWTYTLNGSNCTPCASVTAAWAPPGAAGGTAILTFN